MHVTDAQFDKLRLIRKKYAKQMKKIATTMKKAAKDAMKLQEKMDEEAREIIAPHALQLSQTTIVEELKGMTSFAPYGNIVEQFRAGGEDFMPNIIGIVPDFSDVKRCAKRAMHLADNAMDQDKNFRIITNDKKAEYLREAYNFEIENDAIPPEVNPATHEICPAFRPLTPCWPLVERSTIETLNGGWIVPVATTNFNYESDV